jgi:tetratricopeptide (TPR) repeat protein
LAWAALGQLHDLNWHIADADKAYDKALQLSPRNHMVVYWVAHFHWFQNDDREETLQLARRAVELDPNNYLSWYVLGLHLHAGKAYEEAAVAFRKNVVLAPAEPAEYIELARAEAALGNEARALEALRTVELLMPAESSPGFLAYLAMGYGQLGYRNDAARLLTRVQSVASETYVGPGSWAMLYIGVGDYSQALDALNTAIENPSLLTHFHPFTIIMQNAYLDPILEQPEWMEARSRLGFKE